MHYVSVACVIDGIRAGCGLFALPHVGHGVFYIFNSYVCFVVAILPQ